MEDSTGFSDMRSTAMRAPPTMPMSIASTVNASVCSAAVAMRVSSRYLKYTSQWYASLRAAPMTNHAASANRIAAPIHRPGCGSGFALIGASSSRSVGSRRAPLVVSVIGCPLH